MPGTDRRAVMAKCPFYCNESNIRIICEPFFNSMARDIHLFKSVSQKEKHRLKYCDADYQNCEYYYLLSAYKYYTEKAK